MPLTGIELALLKLSRNKSLEPHEISGVMEQIMTGALSDAQIEEFLLRLREKGETPLEIAAAARVLRKHSLKLSKSYPALLDTCGTGGDGLKTFNISTLAALTAASAGAAIAKHGNRSFSSFCGSADILEMLGVRIDIPLGAIETSIEKHNFGFFFAPKFHEAMRFAMPARRKIRGKTLFNLLGPLSNPAGANYQLVGVYETRLVEVVAKSLLDLGCQRALVVHGDDGLDELTLSGKTLVAELNHRTIKTYQLCPEDVGLERADLADIQCGSKEACKKMAFDTLLGMSGPAMDIVAFNAAAALFVLGKTASVAQGVGLCKELLEKGVVQKKVEALADFTNGISPAI